MLEEGMTRYFKTYFRISKSRMELEELMTNRSLLEKMSDNHTDHQNNIKKYRANGIDGHMKPREIRVEYSKRDRANNSRTNSRSSNSTSATVPLQPTVVIEGYGCKCPVKLKKCLKFLWFLVLLIYVCGMPLVLIRLDTKLRATKNDLKNLEQKLYQYMQKNNNAINNVPSASKQASNGHRTDQSIAKKEMEKYTKVSNLQKEMQKKLSDMEKQMDKQQKR